MIAAVDVDWRAMVGLKSCRAEGIPSDTDFSGTPQAVRGL